MTLHSAAHLLMGDMPRQPRFIIFSSYGNDSVSLIQWAYEQGLRDVCVVFSDTGWAATWWSERVCALEWWVWRLGLWTSRTTSIGFEGLAYEKKGFPTQRYQWCSYRLKIEPAERWMDEHDPEARAICLVGVRQDEGSDRASYPIAQVRSESHGGRVCLAPMATWDAETRNLYIRRAGVEPLPHRSMECSPCINSNRRDLRALTDEDIARAESLENQLHEDLGLTSKGKRRTLFRPHRHMGALGVREVIRWAKAPRGKYVAGEDTYDNEKWDSEQLGSSGCEAGWCGI